MKTPGNPPHDGAANVALASQTHATEIVAAGTRQSTMRTSPYTARIKTTNVKGITASNARGRRCATHHRQSRQRGDAVVRRAKRDARGERPQRRRQAAILGNQPRVVHVARCVHAVRQVLEDQRRSKRQRPRNEDQARPATASAAGPAWPACSRCMYESGQRPAAAAVRTEPCEYRCDECRQCQADSDPQAAAEREHVQRRGPIRRAQREHGEPEVPRAEAGGEHHAERVPGQRGRGAQNKERQQMSEDFVSGEHAKVVGARSKNAGAGAGNGAGDAAQRFPGICV